MSLGSTVALATERVLAPVQGIHRAISGRWFRAVGPLGEPVRRAHDAVANLVYGAIGLGGAALGAAIDASPLVEAGGDDTIRAAVNGVCGDELGRHADRLQITMTVRSPDGRPVDVGSGLEAAFPGAAGRLVVLVHGLAVTERCWYGSASPPGMAQAIEADPDLTPIGIRYNTGLRVSANGSLLASLLDEIVVNWPREVQSIAFVGHSMGGLVIRSACMAGRSAGYAWFDAITDVVTLGAPHLGAPLEKLADFAARGLALAPETRPLADFLDGRSEGIKDLRRGTIGRDSRAHAYPALPEGINHHFVAAAVTADPAHPVGVVAGDLLVRAASGTGGAHITPDSVAVLGGLRHFDLPHDPVVIDRVLSWL